MRTILGLSLLTLIGCAHEQRLVRFHAPPSEADPFEVVVRSLVENGEQPAQVDPKTGVVHTEWQDSGFMYGQIRDKTATIHRRYTAILTNSAAGLDVVLRMDSKRCTPAEVTTVATAPTHSGGTTLSVGNSSVTFGGTTSNAPAHVTTHVAQPCEPMDGVVESHQEALDALGEKLRVALNATRTAG